MARLRPAAMLPQPIYTLLTILLTPFHQAGALTPGDITNFVDRVLLNIPHDSLVARARGCIFGLPIGSSQLVRFVFADLKALFWYLSIDVFVRFSQLFVAFEILNNCGIYMYPLCF